VVDRSPGDVYLPVRNNRVWLGRHASWIVIVLGFIIRGDKMTPSIAGGACGLTRSVKARTAAAQGIA
jgi:hypothetical protein